MLTNSHAVCRVGPVSHHGARKILTAPLSPSQQQAVLTHLVQKCRIVALGAQKRQHETRWATYSAKAQHYQQQLADVRQVAATS
jgi:hypothetical protein